MKSDLDRLMKERNIDAFIIFGDEGEDPYRHYLTNGVHASAAVVKKQGELPVLIVSGMEIDEARKSGLEVKTYVDFGLAELIKEHKSDSRALKRHLWKNIIEQLGVNGRVAFYGRTDVMATVKRLNGFRKDFAGQIEVIEDEDPNIFTIARRTKDEAEIDALRDAGKRTSVVLRATREWLGSHRAQNGAVVKSDGSSLTIGDVKHFVRLKLMENGMEDAEGMIFAQGRDSAIPHSRGESAEGLRVGETIVFDLFPRRMGGGYYHDSTRTWCLGTASDEVKEAYDLVMRAFTQSLEAITVGQPTNIPQNLVCDIFEQQGHKTVKTNPGTEEGYVHSLGHGLGLDVHEAPGMGNYAKEGMVFEVGDVLTVEPGLYYPDKGWGMRVEDTVFIAPDGHIENLTDCPYDLIIPLHQ